MKPIEILKKMILKDQREKYPNIPEHGLTCNIFTSDKPEKREKKRIEKFLILSGCYAAIIENRGQRKDNRKVVTDIIGRQKIIGSVEFIGSGMRKGIADIKATIKGRSVDIELKRVYKKGRDRQSDHQKKEEQLITKAGGVYVIVEDFDSFYDWYCSFINS